MKRKIYEQDEQGNMKPVKTCDDDRSFLSATKALLADKGIPFEVLKTIKGAEKAASVLKEYEFHVEEYEPDVYEQAIDEAPHLGKYIREIQAEEQNGGRLMLTKVKIERKSEWAEIYYNQGTNKNSKEVKYNGYEQVTEEFLNKFRSLTEHVVKVLDFPEEWQDRITTTGISITYKDDELMGMVITSQMDITGLSAPLNLNTPFVKFSSWASSNDCCDDVVLNTDCETLLKEIINHTRAYMNGDTRTRQMSLLEAGGQ